MIYRFANCTLDTSRHALTRDGAPVHVEPQVFALLEFLAERGGELVTRDEIVDRVWNGRIVSEAAISARIKSARVAVGDSGQTQSVIRTVTRRGLQMSADVLRDGEAPAKPGPAVPNEKPTVRMATSRDGSGIAWSARGEGPPVVRAGHWITHLELDLASMIWRPWIDRMGAGRRLIRYDLRGTGLSERQCGPLSFEAFVDDLEAVVDAAGLDRFSLIGTSQSTAVSLEFAARYPERVDRIFSFGGFIQGAKVRDKALGHSMTDALSNMIMQGWGDPGSGFMTAFGSLFIPSASREQIDCFAEMQIQSATAEQAVAIREVNAAYDLVDRLADVKVPVCLVHARGDALHPFSQGQLMARCLPDAELHSVDSNNHILLPDEPAFAEMMDIYDSFLPKKDP